MRDKKAMKKEKLTMMTAVVVVVVVVRFYHPSNSMEVSTSCTCVITRVSA
jgi:hypothetical protein